MIRDVDESLETDVLDHELAFGEELAGEALEQRCFDILARAPEGTKLRSGEICRYSQQ